MIQKILTYIGQIFDSESSTSFARWATALTLVSGIWSMVYLVLNNHALPDALQIGAMAGWMVAPYSVSKVASVFNGDRSGRVGNLSASEDDAPIRGKLPSDERLIWTFVVLLLLFILIAHR